jgi:hypothetical protein
LLIQSSRGGLDKNNLYGEALSSKLPLKNFEWLSDEELNQINILNLYDDDKIGYIFEVNLNYPDSLHDTHNDFRFCPTLCVMEDGVTRLVLTLEKKMNYVIHYRMLKNCLKHGLLLEKIVRGFKFVQKEFIKPYIEKNTILRSKATNSFISNVAKLLNNAVYVSITSLL